MVRHTLKMQMLQDFLSVSARFGTLCIKVLNSLHWQAIYASCGYNKSKVTFNCKTKTEFLELCRFILLLKKL